MKWCVENGEGDVFLISNRFHFLAGCAPSGACLKGALPRVYGNTLAFCGLKKFVYCEKTITFASVSMRQAGVTGVFRETGSGRGGFRLVTF